MALKEVNFKQCHIKTTAYECTVYKLSKHTCKIHWRDEKGEAFFEDQMIVDQDDDPFPIANAEDRVNDMTSKIGSSLFFPTFRRIEGGFSIGEREGGFVARAKTDVEDSMASLSKRLSQRNHTFVSALSTADVVALIVRQYTDLSEQYNRVQQKISQDVIRQIKEFKSDSTATDSLRAANYLLDEIRNQIEGMETDRKTIMMPLTAVRELVMKMLRHSGIQLGKTLRFGEAANAINSDVLSAGEKQMLSFLVYNAFYREAVIFIDEPELSLHVDWQRQLFPILMGQQASNQFIIATHSPFIYSKFPDKELQIDPQRGDELED